jgi:NTP pyrophosphatase (non-canonical NTP hydrolase)
MRDAHGNLRGAVADFATERDWEQFHTPKNLAMALACEVGELVEIFQWLTTEESAGVMSSPRAQDVRDESADGVHDSKRSPAGHGAPVARRPGEASQT